MSIDHKIRDAGLRLSGVAVEVPRSTSVLRRRARVRSIAMISSVALIATGSGLAAWNARAREIKTTAPPPAEQCSNADAYGLGSQAVTALPVERLTAATADSAVWVDNTRTNYLTLTVRPGVAAVQPTPTGIGPMTQDLSFPQQDGQAWFSTTTTDLTRQLNMWWTRTNGDLWLLSGYWYGADETNVDLARQSLRGHALAISIGETDDSYTLADSTMQLVASDRAASVTSRAFVWSYAAPPIATQITLLVIDDSAASGWANLLATGTPVPILINGCQAWRTDATNGDVHVGWVTPQSNAWATLTIPAVLASAADELIAALQSTLVDGFQRAYCADGRQGWVREADLDGEMPANPQEAATQTVADKIEIPCYAQDRVTVIGVFEIRN